MLSAAEINALKEKIKTEMLRRNDTGSLAAFASAEHDFSEIPTAGTAILAEHGQKTVDLMLRVKDYGNLTLAEQSQPIPAGFDTELLSRVDELASETMTAQVTSCRGACTGLCLASCTTECSGCNGQCSGCTGCTASCGTGCAGGAGNA